PITVSRWTTRKGPATNSELPVDILTSSASEPSTNRLSSPMRSFSRIPKIPEAKQIQAVSDVYADPSAPASPATTIERVVSPTAPTSPDSTAVVIGYDQLPPELLSMADNFVESIKQMTLPPNTLSAERLSELFQDFYMTVQEKTSALLRKNNMQRTYEVQMMSFEEMAKKKQERKHKESLKTLYEDLIERKVCEDTYPTIFMYHASDDEAKDATLCTKIAALKLINIKIEHLGVPELKDVDLNSYLKQAMTCLVEINDMKSPRAKISKLITAHKHIVDALNTIRQSKQITAQSSADFVLPTLIYSVVQSDPPHIFSNLMFIQRFRSKRNVNGETAYCLTNFEAVVAFLETVDLQSLNVDSSELPVIPVPTVSTPSPPPEPEVSAVAVPPSNIRGLTAVPAAKFSTAPMNDQIRTQPIRSTYRALSSRPSSPPVDPLQNSPRRMSFHPSDIAASVGSTVGSTVGNTADYGRKTIESSYKYFFGGNTSTQVNSNEEVKQIKEQARRKALEKRTEEVLQSSSALINGLAQNPKKADPRPSTANTVIRPKEQSKSLYDTTSSIIAKVSAGSSGSVGGSHTVDIADEAEAVGPEISPAVPTVATSTSSAMYSSLTRTASPGGEPVLTTKSSDFADTADETIKSRAVSLFDNMQRRFGRTSSVGGTQRSSTTGETSRSLLMKRIAPPPVKFEKMAPGSYLADDEVAELLAEYKRLVAYLKDINAF
ncbi:uncharacterized protein V1516DRAFT_617049, partial [Lipomyces oligophaga]|uniref:uncharacterized protein n=1 Tax=Lipomyces oligophaga TaxID=45792 RepID=UPI0034CFD6BD